MRKALTVVFAMLLFCAFLSVLMAAPACENEPMGGPGKRMMGGEGGMMFMPYSPARILGMASELNLTSDQFEKIKQIEKDSRDGKEKKEDAISGMKDMRAEFEKDSPDEAKIDKMMDTMAAKRVERMKKGVHTMLAVKAVLTKDQLNILKEKKDKMKEKWAGKGKDKGKDKDDKE
jgi:Spy/CpxP family protein refolding chaperone